MSTPPPVTPAAAEEARCRIVARHRTNGEDHPLLESTDYREVLTYLRRCGAAGLLSDRTGDDEVDGLTLKVRLWQELEEVEVFLLGAAQRRGVSRRSTGAVLGVGTSQGMAVRLARKTERQGRTAPPRRPVPHRTASDAAGRTGLDADVRTALAGRLRTAVRVAVGLRDVFPDDVGEDIDDLAAGLGRWHPGTPPPLGMVDDVRTLVDDMRARAIVDRVAASLGEAIDGPRDGRVGEALVELRAVLDEGWPVALL
jgi:hypothetical protein